MTLRVILQLARLIRSSHDFLKEAEKTAVLLEEILGIVEVHVD